MVHGDIRVKTSYTLLQVPSLSLSQSPLDVRPSCSRYTPHPVLPTPPPPPQAFTKFQDSYADINLPVLSIMGNMDKCTSLSVWNALPRDQRHLSPSLACCFQCCSQLFSGSLVGDPETPGSPAGAKDLHGRHLQQGQSA